MIGNLTARQRLQARQNELGANAKKSLGQNFLISDSVIDKILAAVARRQPATILEIGPGMGALTDGLRLMKTPLTLLELDSNFVTYWKSQGMDVIEVDALQWNWDLSAYTTPCLLVSNLPYQISSSLVVDRSLDESPLDCMILMFQKEVAQRMKATPRQGPYGFLSVLAQTFWKVDLLLEASSGDFLPAPKVASRVLVFEPKPPPVKDRQKYLKFLKACFLHPRKYLASNLAHGMQTSKEQVKIHFDKMGLSSQVRAGELTIEKFLELFHLFEG